MLGLASLDAAEFERVVVILIFFWAEMFLVKEFENCGFVHRQSRKFGTRESKFY